MPNSRDLHPVVAKGVDNPVLADESLSQYVVIKFRNDAPDFRMLFQGLNSGLDFFDNSSRHDWVECGQIAVKLLEIIPGLR